MKILDFCWTTFRNKIIYWKKRPSRLRVKVKIYYATVLVVLKQGYGQVMLGYKS